MTFIINTVEKASQKLPLVPLNNSTWVFARGGATPASLTNARLAFYSIGESLDLALLDARVTALITAFGVAIP